MKTFHLILLFILFLFSGKENPAFSQDKSLVKFIVDNENGYFEVLLDDTTLIKQYKDSLTVGEHKALVWSYGYDAQSVSFTVLPNQDNEVYVKLYRSDAYQAYTSSYHDYRMQFHKAVTLPVSLTLLAGITSGTFMLKAYELKKKITVDMENYYSTPFPDEIAAYKASVESNTKKYDRNRYGYYATGAITFFGIGVSTYLGLRFKHNHIEPTYSKVSPFSDRTSFIFTGTGCSIQIRIG